MRMERKLLGEKVMQETKEARVDQSLARVAVDEAVSDERLHLLSVSVLPLVSVLDLERELGDGLADG